MTKQYQFKPAKGSNAIAFADNTPEARAIVRKFNAAQRKCKSPIRISMYGRGPQILRDGYGNLPLSRAPIMSLYLNIMSHDGHVERSLNRQQLGQLTTIGINLRLPNLPSLQQP